MMAQLAQKQEKLPIYLSIYSTQNRYITLVRGRSRQRNNCVIYYRASIYLHEQTIQLTRFYFCRFCLSTIAQKPFIPIKCLTLLRRTDLDQLGWPKRFLQHINLRVLYACHYELLPQVHMLYVKIGKLTHCICWPSKLIHIYLPVECGSSY